MIQYAGKWAWARSWWFMLLLGGGAAAVIAFSVRQGGGAVPPMPGITVDYAGLKDARDRAVANSRALSRKDPYVCRLIDSFVALNQSELAKSAPATRARLAAQFDQATGIAHTAQKDRYIQVGDYLGLRFEWALFQVLDAAKREGLQAVLDKRGPAVLLLERLGGSFVAHLRRQGVIGERGELTIEHYLPRILFARRWRTLSSLPYRYGFLRAEAVVDYYFLLKQIPPEQVDRRLRLIGKIRQIDKSFDGIIARALVYYEAGFLKRALGILQKGQKLGRTDFAVNQFIRYLKNQD